MQGFLGGLGLIVLGAAAVYGSRRIAFSALQLLSPDREVALTIARRRMTLLGIAMMLLGVVVVIQALWRAVFGA